MIVKMSKVTVICLHSQQEKTLNRLQDLAILHLAPIREPEGLPLEDARKKWRSYQESLKILEQYSKTSVETKANFEINSLSQADIVTEEIIELDRKKNIAVQELQGWLHERDLRTPFGNHNRNIVKQLSNKGIVIRVFRGDRRSYQESAAKYSTILLKRDKQQFFFAVVTSEAIEINAKEIDISSLNLQDIEIKIASLKSDISAMEEKLSVLSRQRPTLEWCRDQAEDQIHFMEARQGMSVEGAVSHLRGYCPESTLPQLRKAANENGWGLLIEEATGDEPVPTKIENPSWANLISPIFKLIGVIPGYKELDISPMFLIFFTLFFAIIVGDAGYGAVYLLLTLLFAKKLRRVAPQLFSLLILLSFATMVWGAAQGQYFAISLPANTNLQALKIQWLSNSDNLILLCFVIAAVHLTIAHIWNIIRYSNSLMALAQVGWIMATWTMFFMARNMVLGTPTPQFLPLMFGVGLLLIVLFMTPWRQLKTQWFGHAMLPLTLIGSFVDVISYLRLFAVGMATYMVAQAFNDIIMAFAFSSLTTGLVGILLLILAHGLNLLLAIMGVVVHGVRLNVLEFVGRLDMQWTGVNYTPFERKAKLVKTSL